jgi:hypothetical protein
MLSKIPLVLFMMMAKFLTALLQAGPNIAKLFADLH